MEGTAGFGSGPRGRRRLFPVLLVVAAVAVGTIGGIWYLFDGLRTNTPPHSLSVQATPDRGDNETTFTFSAQVMDDQDDAAQIRVRWDWENDSTWDTPWNATRVASYRFPQPGDYAVRVEAIDTGGLTAVAVRSVRVTHVPLRMGTVLPLTGALSTFGVSQQKAVEMAIAEINAAGGVFSEPIQLFSEDDQTDSAFAGDIAAALIDSKRVVAIIGSTASGSCDSILPVVQARRVFEVAPGCTSPVFSDPSRTRGWFARTVPSDALQAVVGASYARVNLSFVRAGAIAVNNPVGSGTARTFVENFSRLGGSITGLVLVDPFMTDYTADLHVLLNPNPAPEIVYASMYPPSGAIMIRNWWDGLGANPGWRNVTWLFSDFGFDETDFIGPLVSAGVNVSGFQATTAAMYAGIPSPRSAVWAARYQTRYGTAPALFAANAYDAAYLVALAAEAARFPTGDTIRAQLSAVANPAGMIVGPGDWSVAIREIGMGHDVNYEGASGSVDVDPRGDVIAPYAILAVNSSNQIYVKEFFTEGMVASSLPPAFAPHTPQVTSSNAPPISSVTIVRDRRPESQPRTYL